MFLMKNGLTTLAAAPRYVGAKKAFHIQQQPLKWFKAIQNRPNTFMSNWSVVKNSGYFDLTC